MKKNEFRTRRLFIRPLKMSDYPQWRAGVMSGLAKQDKWDREPLTKKEASKARFQKLVSQIRQMAKMDDVYIFSVFEKRSGKLIGTIDFDVFIRACHQFANFGYFISNTHRGMGYGQEAARAGLTIGFKHLKLNRLEAAINLDNHKSIRLAKSIGMRREGIKRRYWYEHGEWVDHLIYVANPEDIGLKPRKPARAPAVS